MRIPHDATHYLGCVQGDYLDGRLMMPNAGAGDFINGGVMCIGGYNEPGALGLYWSDLALSAPPVQVHDPSGNNWFINDAIGFWSDGVSRWVMHHDRYGSTDSDGHHWTDRVACGSSRQGDWCFIRQPDFSGLIVRRANGAEATINVGGYFYFGGCEDGIVLLHLAGGGVREFTTDGQFVRAHDLPNSGAFTRDQAGRIWVASYQPAWGHCLARLDELPYVYTFFNDPCDFNPAIACRPDGLLLCVTGENAGETVTRRYLIDPVAGTWRYNDEPNWRPLHRVNWRDPVNPPDPIPPDPIPPDPVPPDPIPPDPVPPDPIPPDPIPVPPDPTPEPNYWGALLMAFDPNQIRPLQHVGENALPNNRFTYNAPKNTPLYDEYGEGAVLSIQENGKIECRPKGTAGAFESFVKDPKTGAVTVNNIGFNESGNYWTFVPNNVSGL